MNVPDESYLRGRRDEAIDRRFVALEARMVEQERLVESLSTSIQSLNSAVSRFEASVSRREAVDEALLNKQLTARQFYFGIGSLIAAFGLILVTILTTLH